ncbi:hypothetical protein I4I73_15290 [Pseudonocardia sp. KRD-184]|uniref:DoxX-like protein n=1 Tax=Pseudonocardia oceani TaxID=2792013 RepID=A0ABS6UC65_9PSEU|nr:hypothetical protein [Pseudonocardia oceani]MBW0097350.1 hypothetical protein [Pseudonocardia oceani]MBW0111219.1 hypothetical protein [Pseudonocardia oceani]MBW0123808.1 hypothetical protein [Pseudonocardia oceani]MBW0129825.1 hypothetical protein [Pseudonocardia oceani]
MTSRAALALAGLLAAGGVAHFAVPEFFDAIVPAPPLPGTPRFWTHASGVAELGVAAAVAVPRTRRLGALAAVALFVAVFPANVKMALDRSDRSAADQAIAWGRLPLQVPLVLWALKVRRDAR